MSFKGISWAGNVYQKFEAMCLEVEEAMYQDTVKYMENQVQKVGVSVKKFCSEVLDDMRPLSCIDPTSLTSDDVSFIPYGYTDVNKKPIPGVLDKCRDLKKNENEDKVISNVTAENGSSLNGNDVELFSPQSPGILIENKSPEKFAASKKIGVQRRLIGIKRISKSNHPSKDTCRSTSVSEDRRSKVANCDTRTSSRVEPDNTGVTSSSDFDERCERGEAVKGNAPNLHNPTESPASNKSLPSESVRQDCSRAARDDSNVTSSSNMVMMHEPGEALKGNTPLQDNLFESPASDNVSSAESTRQIEDVSDFISPASDNNLSDESVRLKGDLESTSSCSGSPAGASVNDIVGSSSFRSKVCDLEYEQKGVTASNEGTPMEDGLSSVDSTSCNAASSDEDLVMSNKDSFDIELVENDEVSEPRLEESCILVEGDELHCALQGTRKHKSYKKRIREALSSKLRTRKDEHLLSLHQQESMSVRVREEQKLSARDSVDSDWELL